MGNTYMEPAPAVRNPTNVILGLLLGGLIGATAMLFLAPQSGQRTRALLQRKSTELRSRTTELGKRALAQIESVPTKLRHVTGKLGE